MRILLVYGTTEGHTRRLARFCLGRLQADGHAVTLADAAEGEPPDPAGFDATLVCASLHLGHYQSGIIHFARAHHAALNAQPSAFVSVSLSAAGRDPDDLMGLADSLAHFERETSWTPLFIHQAAGAIRFSAYDFFRKLAIKFIAERRGQHVSTDEDYDFTDYEALAAFLDDVVTKARA